MSIKTLVEVELQERLEKLNRLAVTDEEYKVTDDSMLKLLDRYTKMEELDILSKENEIKLAQANEDRKARNTDQWLKFAGIAVPVIFASGMALVCSVIERTEVNTNTPTREFMKRALRLS